MLQSTECKYRLTKTKTKKRILFHKEAKTYKKKKKKKRTKTDEKRNRVNPPEYGCKVIAYSNVGLAMPNQFRS